MDTKKQYTVQLESFPYFIKYTKIPHGLYCCIGKCLKGIPSKLMNKKTLIYFNTRNYIWSQSLKSIPGYKVIRKIDNINVFLSFIKKANPNTLFLINGKEI